MNDQFDVQSTNISLKEFENVATKLSKSGHLSIMGKTAFQFDTISNILSESLIF